MRKFLIHPLTLAFLLAFALRLLPATWNYVIGTDEALYLTLGGHLAAGHGFTADGIHPHSEFDPGYPAFAAVIYRLTNTLPFDSRLTASDVWRLELPARLNILLLGSLLVVPVYFLARELGSGDRAFASRAAFLTATVPALVLGVPNFEAASEQLYTLALWSGWLFLWLGLKRLQARWFLFSGIAFGVAHLTRWEGLISAAVAVLIALVWVFRSSSVRNPQKFGAVLALIMGALLLAAPYAWYQTARTGSVFSTKSIVHQLHGEALASSDPYAWEKSYANYELVRDNPGLYPPLPVYLWEHRTQTAVNYARNTVTQLVLIFTSPTFLFALWLPLAILGATRFRRAQNLFLAATLAPALFFPISVVDARYLLPLIPAGMLWVAHGLGVADNFFASRISPILCRPSSVVRHGKRSESSVVHHLVTIALLTLFILADLAAPFFIPRPTEFRTAGLALRGTLPPGAPVLMRRRQIAFYANVAYESLPFSDLNGVLDYARKKGADYFIVDARTTPTTRPQLAYLLGEPNLPPVTVVYDSSAAPQVIVYRIGRN